MEKDREKLSLDPSSRKSRTGRRLRLPARSLNGWLTRRKLFVIWGILVLLMAGSFLTAKLLDKNSDSSSRGSSHVYDSKINKESESIWTDETALYSYVKKFGGRQTIQQLHTLSARLGDCHENAHKAGRFAYEVSGEKAFQEGSAECHAGMYHGATEAFFKDKGTANLNQNLKTLCAYGDNNFFNHQCIHGVGHGLMAWANYELPEALKICDTLEKMPSSCHTGVFMENIVGGLASENTKQQQKELAGHFTKYLSNDPHYPCSAVEEKYKNSCYFLQTSRMLQLYNGDFAKVAQACAQAPAIHQTSCFSSMGRDVGGSYRQNPEGAITACRQAAGVQHQNSCISSAVQDTFWDPSGQASALQFCGLLTGEVKAECYNVIIERARDVLAGRNEREKFCAKTESGFMAKCRQTLL